ncbi:restriction endonuclease subunit S [Eubacterium limosum]|uniref:Restriction endonuclease subunit S n=1 Tax=Eubacterium limosum TaxID=1736 RepID=A0ABT5UTB0_EUBLI|nr:restriction endonuclease subunit S [Eubacterium limosum]MCB6571973.1 restriction endonuclease subunit S [Eubacterium limosum]MDE1472203.1 restriction endonuclease subunit S [Eubacterium limosum]
MNYLTELLAFYRWLETTLISPIQQAYWHLLMWANNRAAVRDELGDWYWPVDFNLPNTVVMRFLGLKKHYQVVHLRDQLIRTGRVQYEKHPAQRAGTYRLNPFNQGLEAVWIVAEKGCARTQVWNSVSSAAAPGAEPYINPLNNKQAFLSGSIPEDTLSPNGFNLLPEISEEEKAAIRARFPDNDVAAFYAIWEAREKKQVEIKNLRR